MTHLVAEEREFRQRIPSPREGDAPSALLSVRPSLPTTDKQHSAFPLAPGGGGLHSNAVDVVETSDDQIGRTMQETPVIKKSARALKSLERLRTAQGFADRMGKLFLLPGDLVCDWLGVGDRDSRFLLRMFVNLSVYGHVAVMLVFPFV